MIPVTGRFNAPDPSVKPASFAQCVDQLNGLFVGSIDQTISTFVMGVDVPSVENQSFPWFRINTIGAPVGWYAFRLGVWTREEPIVSARFGLYSGPTSGFFDGTGKGLKGPGPIAGDYWGWSLMNGQNGTVNLSNRFIIMGAMDDSGIVGFNNGWRTNVTGSAQVSGGVSEITMDGSNSFIPEILVGRHDATGEANGGGNLFGIEDPGHDFTLQTANTPGPISIVNPFYAFAMIQFTGYVD